jgi:hypothetical protein
MTTEIEAGTNIETGTEVSPAPKRPLVSVPFLVIVAVLGIGGYFAGPTILTQYYYLTGDKAGLEDPKVAEAAAKANQGQPKSASSMAAPLSAE